MSKAEHARRAIIELIASDPNGDWSVHQICERIYGHPDHLKREVIRRALQNMSLPGTWRLGWNKRAMRLYDPCSDARLADLEKRIEHLTKKGWHENAKACAEAEAKAINRQTARRMSRLIDAPGSSGSRSR